MSMTGIKMTMIKIKMAGPSSAIPVPPMQLRFDFCRIVEAPIERSACIPVIP